MRAAIALIAALLLCGCAGTFWHASVEWGQPLVSVEVLDMSPAYCGCHESGAWACATVNPQTHVCTICLPKSTPSYQCVLWHELTHCAGFEHPNFSYSFITCPQ